MHIPYATYRIQFIPSFGFKDCAKIISYFYDLGVSHVYASPILKARSGSQHGYDVTDPIRLNEELGSQDDFNALMKRIREKNMFWLQDIVPNHMAYHKENKMLMDIFEKRDHSVFFEFFDIDWVHPYETYQGRVLAPFLGKFYSEALSDGEIQLVYNEQGLFFQYYELCYPLLLTTYKDVLFYQLEELEKRLGKNSPMMMKYFGAVDIFDVLCQQDTVDLEDHRVDHAKKILWACYQDSREIQSFVNDNLAFFNGRTDKQKGWDAFDQLLSKQCYRLSFWKVASEELNYRRFFTINELISLKVEQPDVFNYTHQFLSQLVQENKIHGLRIDHVDGLYNPTTYLKQLALEMHDTYIVAEKILAAEENLPPEWPIQGTTGYDFLNMVNGLFCQRESLRDFIKIYYKFTKLHQPYEQLVWDKKRLIIGKHMAGDIDNLAYLMKKVASRDRYGRDITLYGLKRALVEVVTTFPVYRTYLTEDFIGPEDKKYIKEAIAKARKKFPGLEYEFNFIEKFLLMKLIEFLNEEEKRDFWHFIMRFQQITSPIMAKGFEDTVFYSYNKLISLNEVGGDPGRFGTTLEEFHAFNQKHFNTCPYTMNTTATHDTKRGEDARTRINVLSELPNEWTNHVKNWSKLNRAKKKKAEGEYYPDANDEYFIYQTLIGSYPLQKGHFPQYKQRLKDYVIKAIREAKIYTAWIKPDVVYEEACLTFVDRLLSGEPDNKFIKEFESFQKGIAHYGLLNSLSQVLLKVTSPGVPDFYQGTELWDFSFVDPDNRRPVDYKKRISYLEEIRFKIQDNIAGFMQELLSRKEDGRIKLFLMHQALQARKRHCEIFIKGEYQPLLVKGKYHKSVIAYQRCLGPDCAVIIAPRFLTRLIKADELPLGEEVWEDTCLSLNNWPEGEWYESISQQNITSAPELKIGAILQQFPVALLIKKVSS